MHFPTKTNEQLVGFGYPAVNYSLIFFMDTAFMQYLKPDGSGPSGKICPRWASQQLQITSTLSIPKLWSLWYPTAFGLIGCVNEGQPLPLSNFWLESKSKVPQQVQAYFPGSKRLHISEEKALSVPFSLVI